MRIVDLSYDFYPRMYPNKKFPELDVTLKPVTTLEKDGVNMLLISFGNHLGTHIDGPRHIIPGGKMLDEMPIELFYGTGVVLNMKKGPDEAIGRKDLQNARPAIKDLDIVLLHTGWDAKFGSPDYREHHAYLDEDGARFLVEKKVRLVGIDAVSVDFPSSLRKDGFNFVSLRILLENGVLPIHNLRNMEAVAGKRVTVVALPVRFRGADSAPARVVALVE